MAERWSMQWVMRGMSRKAVMGPRIIIAVLLPLAVAFFSLPLAAIVAIPCLYIAWTQPRSLWPDL